MNAARSANRNRIRISITGMKTAHPLTFGTVLAIKSVFGNAVLDEDYHNQFFFFLNPLRYISTVISQRLVSIDYDLGGHNGRRMMPLVPSFFAANQQLPRKWSTEDVSDLVLWY